MAKKKEVSDKVIKDLQTENKNFKTEREKIGLKQLLGELDDLKDINKKKEDIIQNLQKENNDMLKKLNTCKSESSDDLHKLIKEIEEVQKINHEKEASLNDIERSKDILKGTLFQLEKENDALKEQLEEKESGNGNNLSDELGILDKRSHNVSPVSDASDVDTNLKKHNEKIHGVSLVKKIWKLKELQLGQSKNSQKLKF